MKKEVTQFNKTHVYNQEIAEKLNDIVRVCNREKIPMFVSLCLKNDEKESVYINDMVSAYTNDIVLYDDMIPRFVNVINGFITIPRKDDLEVEFDSDSI